MAKKDYNSVLVQIIESQITGKAPPSISAPVSGGNKGSSASSSGSSGGGNSGRPNDFAPISSSRGDSKKKDSGIAPFFENILSSVKSRITLDAPVTQKNKQSSGFFQKGALEDGFSGKNLVKTILGSGGDLGGNLVTGASGGLEKALLGLTQIAPALEMGQRIMNSPGVKYQFDIDEYREKQAQNAEIIKKGLWDETAISRTIFDAPLASIGVDINKDSVFGARSDSLTQSAGQLLGSAIINRFVPGSGSAAIFLSAAGGEAQNALINGATPDEALVSSLVSGTGELLTEKISGAIKFGGKALDDEVVEMLGSQIKNRAGRALAKIGIDAAGEGTEEILSGLISAVGQKMTYMSDAEIEELFSAKDAFNSFVDGAILGGLFGSFETVKQSVNGNDVTTGLPVGVQQSVDRLFEEAVVEYKKGNNGKISPKERVQLYDELLRTVVEEAPQDIQTVETETLDAPVIEADVSENIAPAFRDADTHFPAPDVKFDADNSTSFVDAKRDYAELQSKLEALTAEGKFGEEFSTLSQQWVKAKETLDSLGKGDIAPFSKVDSASDPSVSVNIATIIDGLIKQENNRRTIDKSSGGHDLSFGSVAVSSDSDHVAFSDRIKELAASAVENATAPMKPVEILVGNGRRVSAFTNENGELVVAPTHSPDGEMYIDANNDPFFTVESEGDAPTPEVRVSDIGWSPYEPEMRRWGQEPMKHPDKPLKTKQEEIPDDKIDLSTPRLFTIDDYVIYRQASSDGTHFSYMIESPEGTRRWGVTDMDIGSFYEDVATKLEDIIIQDSELPAAPIAPVANEPSYEENTEPTQRAKILLESPLRPDAKRSETLNVEPNVPHGKASPLALFEKLFIGGDATIERLSDKAGNRALQSKYRAIRSARNAAQRFIEKGSDVYGVTGLKDIVDRVESQGAMYDFSYYLGHKLNIDRMTLEERGYGKNKGIFGDVTAAESRFEVDRLDSLHPEFKELSEQIYGIQNHLRQKMVDSRLITQEFSDKLAKKYPHYIPISRVPSGDGSISSGGNSLGVSNPIKTATGGNSNILPLFETMANRILSTYRAAAMNNFGIELANTIDPGQIDNLVNPGSFNFESVEEGYSVDGFDPRVEWMNSDDSDGQPTYTVVVDGKDFTFPITKDLFEAMKPAAEWSKYRAPGLSQISDFRRRAITAWSYIFGSNNFLKDLQTVRLNSQHPIATYVDIVPGIVDMFSNSGYYPEYLENGGESSSYFDSVKNKFDPDLGVLDWLEQKTGLRHIVRANDFIEKIPRYAEYRASREAGRDIDESMLDASRVTVDFSAGGDLTRLLDRNGMTFLNASVQGFAQNVRNIREAKKNGLGGWLNLASKALLFNLGANALNGLIWGDDEEYENLQEYVKDNYYIVGKFGDGEFVRIPKERTDAVIQDALEQISKSLTGDDEADWKNFFRLFMENVAPNNPLDDNVFAPIVQTVRNKSWYDGDIVSKRLQKLPTTEQFDEKTDEISITISKWLDEVLDYEVSPKKVNYLLDQYSGVFGDTILPYFTPKASTPSDNILAPFFSPFRNKFTVDSVFNDRSQGEYYDTFGELTERAEADGADVRDVLLNEYMGSFNYELGDLYGQMRDIQMSDRPNSEKYREAKKIKERINDIQKAALDGYDAILSGKGKFNIDGIYAEVGDKRFDYSEDDKKWYSIGPSDHPGVNSYYENEQAITKAYDIGYSEYWNNKEKYDDIYFFAGKYREDPKHIPSTAADVIFGMDNFAKYASDINDMHATEDGNGGYVSGSKWSQVKPYINSLDIPDIEKKILKKIYFGEGDYGYDSGEIIRWLDKNPEISDAQFWKIAEELGYLIDEHGHITWEVGKK